MSQVAEDKSPCISDIHILIIPCFQGWVEEDQSPLCYEDDQERPDYRWRGMLAGDVASVMS